MLRDTGLEGHVEWCSWTRLAALDKGALIGGSGLRGGAVRG
jgi:hypothetical protein